MLTIIVHAKIKESKLEEYLEAAELIIREIKGKRPGCISYFINQSLDSPTEFVIYEQWENEESMKNHMNELYKLFGEPAPGYPVPMKLLAMYESAKPVYYKEIGTNA